MTREIGSPRNLIWVMSCQTHSLSYSTTLGASVQNKHLLAHGCFRDFLTCENNLDSLTGCLFSCELQYIILLPSSQKGGGRLV